MRINITKYTSQEYWSATLRRDVHRIHYLWEIFVKSLKKALKKFFCSLTQTRNCSTWSVVHFRSVWVMTIWLAICSVDYGAHFKSTFIFFWKYNWHTVWRFLLRRPLLEIRTHCFDKLLFHANWLLHSRAVGKCLTKRGKQANLLINESCFSARWPNALGIFFLCVRKQPK